MAGVSKERAMTTGGPQSPSTALRGVSSLYMGRCNIQPALPTWSQDLDGCWCLPDGKVHTARALLLLGVSDLQTRAEEGTGRRSWNSNLLSGNIFHKVCEISTLPSISNSLIRNYYPLFLGKQGSERASSLPKITQQRNIRVIEAVEPRWAWLCGE